MKAGYRPTAEPPFTLPSRNRLLKSEAANSRRLTACKLLQAPLETRVIWDL